MRVLGVTAHLLMGLEGRAAAFWFLIRDRAGQFTVAFDVALAGAGIEVLKIPPRSPRVNAYAGRWVRTARSECTGRMLITGPRHVRVVLDGYSTNYSQHRPHRARDLRRPDCDGTTAAVACLATARI